MSTNDRLNFIPIGLNSSLEGKLIEVYLLTKGYRTGDMKRLPRKESKQLMTEACTHVSLKLAEYESKAKFREKIRWI